MPLISSPPGIGPASTSVVRSPARAAAIAAAMPEAPAPRMTTSLSTTRDWVANSWVFSCRRTPVGREGPCADYFSRPCRGRAGTGANFRILNNMNPIPALPPAPPTARRACAVPCSCCARSPPIPPPAGASATSPRDRPRSHHRASAAGRAGRRAARRRVAGSRRYTLGALAFELGVAAAPYFSLDRLAGPALARLATNTRDIVFLNVRSGFESVCIARHEGRAALKAYTVDVGTRRPLCLRPAGSRSWCGCRAPSRRR